MREEYVRVRGLRIRVTRSGRGRPLLLIMGLGGVAETWEPLRCRLGGHELIMVDHPGTGSSQLPALPMDMPAIADLYAGLMTELGHHDFDVLGYSFGGTVAQTLAHRHPGRVGKLILAATAPGWGGVAADPLTLAVASHPLRYLLQSFRAATAPFVYRGHSARRPKVAGSDRSGPAPRLGTLIGVAYQVLAYSCWTSVPWLHTLQQPTLVFAGAEDPMAPLPNSRILAYLIPGARLEIVADGGHLFLFEEADHAASVIEGFLADPPSTLGETA